MTLPEVQIWILLRRSGIGTRFRRQHPIGPYILDFYAPDARLAVEIDGAAHDIAAIATRDIHRDRWLAERGIRVLRFNAIDVLNPQSREAVLATIAAAVACRA